MLYRHTQIGWPGLVLAGAGISAAAYHAATRGNVFAGAAALLLVFLAVLFPSLTIIVEMHSVTIRFGFGAVVKTIERKDVAFCRPVRNRWWHGWGIRKIPKGWLFNVNGLDAVEITMKDGRVYRIGTDEPVKLISAVECPPQ